MLLLLLLHYKLGGIPLAEDKEKSLTDETLPQEPEEKSDGWDWDAAVPQTDTTNITFDDLQETELKIETEPAEKEDEEKTEEEAQNPDDDGLCIVCGKRRGNSPSDLYCNECRAKFLRTNYGIGHIILAFVMVIVAALGYFVCTSTVTVSGKLFKAEQCISEKRYNDALNLCSDVLEATDKLNSGVNSVIKGINENIRSLDWFTEGSKSAQIILETYAQTMTINYQDRSTFTSAVDKFVEDGQFELSQNSRIKELYDLSKSFDTLEETLVTKLNNYISEKEDGSYDVKYDEAIKYLDSVKTESDVQKSLVDYYRFMMAYYAEKDADVILGFLGDAYEASGEYKYLYSEVYLAMAWENKAYDTVLNVADEAIKFNKNDASAYYYTVRVYIEKGDLDTADKMCEELREANPDGLDYYSTKAELLRRRNKLEDAIEICRKGIVAGSDAEIYRQQAIAYLLLSDKENALEAITQSYEIAMQNNSNGISLEELNTVALICFICGDTDTYDEIVAMFEQYGESLNEKTQKCIKGDITFEDIFMKGSGEIS